MARPRLYDDKKDIRVQFRLDKKTIEKFDKLCKKNNRSRTAQLDIILNSL